MLFLLRQPRELLGVTLALVIGVVAHCLAQVGAARAAGDRMPRASGRLSVDPRRHVDAFGIIAMLLAGIGWNRPVPLQEPRFRRDRTRYVLAVLAGPLANLLLGVLGLVGLRLLGVRDLTSLAFKLDTLTFPQTLVFEFTSVNTALAVVTLIPIPPLDGARLLWLAAPRTPGWQKARYYLEEQNVGIGICLALTLPVLGAQPLIVRLALTVSSAILTPLATALGIHVTF